MGRGPEGAEPQFANRGDAVVKHGPLATDTAVAVMREADGSRRIRFFPQKQMGFVSIDLAASGFEPAEVVALDAEGNPVAGSLDGVERGSGTLTIRHRDPRVWSFRLTPGKGRTGR